MEDLNITQTFQVQLLNSTLKFIKDDSQLLKEYSQMPSNHVVYLHNLICHYKSRLGLGFKSLYFPVWEAMQIYSVKYQFKITVEKSKNGLSGHLTMEKIPKNVTVKNKEEEENEKLEEEENEKMEEEENEKLEEEENEKMEEENEKMEEENEKMEEEENEKINPHQFEPLDTQPEKEEPQQKQQKKTKKLSRVSSKLLENNKIILDTLCPLFIETSLASIQNYISDEWCVTKIFVDLAPTESKFFTNITSLAQRKNDFEEQLSPLSYEILSDISDYLNSLTNSRLNIHSKLDIKSNKREVIFTKVTLFRKKKRAKKMSKHAKKINAKRSVTPKISNDINERELEENSTISTNKKAPKQPPTIERIIHSIHNMNIDSKFEDVETNESLLKDSNTRFCFCKFSVSVNEETENKWETENIYNVPGTKNEDLSVIPPDNVSVDEETENKWETETIDNVPSLTNEALRELVLRNGISFTKEGTTNTDDIENLPHNNDLWDTQIYRDMRVPITIENAERIMRLMGWTGGALGARGNGIMEPVIPIQNYQYTGLGHPSLKQEQQDTTFEYIMTIPDEFGGHIAAMIYDEYQKASISAHIRFTDDEVEYWKNTVDALNRREKLDDTISCTHHINMKMKEYTDITFSIRFIENNTRMIIKKIKFEETTQKKVERPGSTITAPEKKNNFKRVILELIKELLKSGENERVLKFKNQIQPKHINCLFLFIEKINERKRHIKMGQKYESSKKSSTETSDRRELYLAAEFNNAEKTVTLSIKAKQATDTDN